MDIENTVFKYIDEEIIRKAKNKNDAQNWLVSLRNECYNKVFCINLYIDLKKKYLNESTVIEIINNMDGFDGKECFCTIIQKNQDKYLCINETGAQLLDENDRYIRVLDLDNFIYHYWLPKGATLTEAIRKEVMEKFFCPPPGITKESLNIITKTWRGIMNCVWVTSLNYLKQRITDIEKEQQANYVCNAMGWDCSGNIEIVYIMYPVKFNLVDVRKPTTLDAHPVNKFFLSIDSDTGWGKTCSADGNSDGLFERIHKHFPGLSNEFEGEWLGSTSIQIECAEHILLQEAKNRASNI